MSLKHKIAPVALSVPLMFALSGTALAETATSANLEELNNSGASGSAMAMVDGSAVHVTVQANGVLAGAPHAQHIHFGAEARHECPTMAEDKDGNGRLNTTEGAPAYGPVGASLTLTGDTSPKSVLAVERFPTPEGESYSYDRQIEVSSELAQAIQAGQGVVVVHGVDYDNSGKYDGAEKSDLNPALPTEATDPAICGVLAVAPAGGADTGAGGAMETNEVNNALVGLGSGLVLLAAGGGAFVARRARD